MKNLKYVFFIIMTFILFNASGQIKSQDEMKNCLQAIYKDKKKVKKSDRLDKISIAFFQDFSDTVTLYLNRNAIYKNYIFHDSSKVSSIFTDSITTIKVSGNGSDTINIFYKNLNKFLAFPVNNKYALYTIHSYITGKCFVSARRGKALSLK